MPRLRRAAALGAALIAPLLFVGYGMATAPLRVVVTIHFSSFVPARIAVPHDRPVTFVITNSDPIDHEWIVGDEQLHARHRTGTEPHHEGRPTELSIPALGSRTTTITFTEPATLRYICHLPGHEAYGMTGTLIVDQAGPRRLLDD